MFCLVCHFLEAELEKESLLIENEMLRGLKDKIMHGSLEDEQKDQQISELEKKILEVNQENQDLKEQVQELKSINEDAFSHLNNAMESLKENEFVKDE